MRDKGGTADGGENRIQQWMTAGPDRRTRQREARRCYYTRGHNMKTRGINERREMRTRYISDSRPENAVAAIDLMEL